MSQLYDRAVIKSQNEHIRSQVAQILLQHEHIESLLVSPRDFAILVDATDHEYKIPLEYFTSFRVSFIYSRLLIELHRCQLLMGVSSNLRLRSRRC